jgi:hypothetical protein
MGIKQREEAHRFGESNWRKKLVDDLHHVYRTTDRFKMSL